MRSRMFDFLLGRKIRKNNTTFQIIGCSPIELKEYLEKQFNDGMNWENYGYYGWHVDHKMPLDFGKNEENVLKLFHYTNLQPMWWFDNFSKGNKFN